MPAVVGPWQANCYVVAPRAGRPGDVVDAVIIDPGMGALPVVADLCERHHLRVAGVIATHGHFDHVADAAAIADAAGVPVHIHPSDEHLLTHPLEGLSTDLAAMIWPVVGERLAPPRRVQHLAGNTIVESAGVSFTLMEAPGHTPGCTLLSLTGVLLDDDPRPRDVTFTGDVVFAGSIGRLDLPGGDPAAMRRSLDAIVHTLPASAYLLPGHGRATTMARERAGNPYLSPNAAPLS